MIMKSFDNDFYDYDYTGEQAENSEEENGGGEEIDSYKVNKRGERNK